MKHTITALSLALAIPAFGGSKEVIAEPSPAPCISQWFVGGSFGMFSVDGSSNYDGSDITIRDVADIDLDEVFEFFDPNGQFRDTGDDTFEDYVNDFTQGDFEDVADDPLFESINNVDPGFANGLSYNTEITDVDLNMYSVHVGRSFCEVESFDLSAYLEVAWLTGDFNATGVLTNIPQATQLVLFDENFDVDIVPITLNLKAEHALFGPVGGYLSVGLGYAFTNISGSGYDESGGGFYAQAAAGLVWNVTEQVDIYGGARWIHLSDLDYGDDSLGFELDDQIGFEIGARYTF